LENALQGSSSQLKDDRLGASRAESSDFEDRPFAGT
jgi:hypothetical protein